MDGVEVHLLLQVLMHGKWTVSLQIDPTLYIEKLFLAFVNGRHEDVDGLLLKRQYLVLKKKKSFGFAGLDMRTQLFQKIRLLLLVCEKCLNEKAFSVRRTSQ